jgi:hypothetical protein
MWVIIAELEQSFFLPLFATAIPTAQRNGHHHRHSFPKLSISHGQIGVGIWAPGFPLCLFQKAVGGFLNTRLIIKLGHLSGGLASCQRIDPPRRSPPLR